MNEKKPRQDESFHETAWNFTPDQEARQLERVSSVVFELEEQQVRSIAARSKTFGAEAYRQLIARYPSHAKVAEWQKRIEELER